MKPRAAPERAIQIAIRHRLQFYGITCLHIPNGGQRSVMAGRRLRGEGMMAGAPDLICIAPGGQVALLEVKAPGGRVSEAQRDFHALLASKGHRIAVVHSQDEALEALRAWGLA